MRLPVTELRALLAVAERYNRPVDIDFANGTVTVLDSDADGALKVYVIRDRHDGTITVTDRS